MKTGIELIAIERQEQIEKHGFDKDHDEEMINGELIDAAVYLLTGEINYLPKSWDEKWHLKFRSKFSNEIESLKVAGALIAAEIDRIQTY
ncbi:MAG TPA: hypothetical protein VI911_00060 [Patescibacteria group bacterium]|nr:hypothetical protein [Patescibacteria group bacterium]